MSPKELDDEALLEAMAGLASDERVAASTVIEHLAEVDHRKLYIGRGYTSLYEYCHHGLRYPEGAAYRRIRGARAVQKRPSLLEDLRFGRLTLETLTLLHPHLDAPYGNELLERAKGLSCRRVEMLLAEYQIVRAAPDLIRFVGMERTASNSVDCLAPVGLPSTGAIQAPIGFLGVAKEGSSRKLVRFAFTADEEMFKLVRHAQALLRHKYPDGRLEGVIGDALKVLISKKDPLFRRKNGPKSESSN